MKKSLMFLLSLSGLWLLVGCGGGTSGPPPPLKAITITFGSGRALDGSDAINAPNQTFNVWVVNADGSGTTPLTKLTANNADSFGPVRSTDGTKIAFNSSRALDGSDAANSNVTFNIWVMNADGSGAIPVTKLTASGAYSFVSAWSPDDSKIAFSSSRALDGSDLNGGTENTWVVNPDGSGATPLAVSVAGSFAPAWSPDGSKIAFQSGRALDGSNALNANDNPNIWVMNADGSGATSLTKLTAVQPLNIVPGIWLPDGSKIVFDSARALDGTDAANSNGTRNIWIMNADGSSAAPLTKLTASGTDSLL